MKRRIGWIDLLWYVLGCGIYAASVRMFITPHRITPGGFTGFAALFHQWIGLQTGTIVLILNIPVLWLGFRCFGKGFILKTAAAIAILSGTLNIAEYLPPVRVQRGLAAVFGGLAMGFGLSLVLLHGATTGGVDIVAKLVNRRYPHLTVGRVILCTDALVVLLNALVYRDVESALYSIIALYASTRVTDLILYGADRAKMILAVTRKPDGICHAIHTEMRRGVTKARVTGSYSDEDYTLLLCTVRRHEIADMYRIVSRYDADAFMVIADVGEVLGEGFKRFSR